MTLPLFDDDSPAPFGAETRLGDQAVVLRGWALPQVAALWPALQALYQGVVLDFPRLSTLGCRHLDSSSPGYWARVGPRLCLGLVLLSASVYAGLMLRALHRPPPVLDTMRRRAQHLQQQIDAIESRA